MAIRRHTIIVAFVATAIIFILVAVITSILVDPDRYRPQVVAYLSAKTGKQIEIGHLWVHWLPLAVQLDDFASQNPKPFPPGYFLKAKRVDAAIDALALLHRKIMIKSLVLHEPVINVVSDPDGLWNFENPPAKDSAKKVPIFALGVIPQVRFTGGRVLGSSLIDPSDRPGPIVFEAVNVSARLTNVDFNAFTNLTASAKDSAVLVAQGDMSAASLRLGSVEVTDVRSKLRLMTKQISLTDVSVEADRGRATGVLTFDLSGAKAHFNTDVRLSGLDVARLLVAFPGGRGKMTGRMEGHLKFDGAIEHTSRPLEGIRGTGNLTVRDGDLPSLSSNDNLRKMTRFRDPRDASRAPSAFSSFSSDLDLAGQRISSRQINVAFYGIDVQCAGDLGLANGGTLNYQGVAKVLKKQGFFTNLFAKALHGADEKDGKLLFPIRIKGTMLNPRFSIAD